MDDVIQHGKAQQTSQRYIWGKHLNTKNDDNIHNIDKSDSQNVRAFKM